MSIIVTEDNKVTVLGQLLRRGINLVGENVIADIAYSVCIAEGIPAKNLSCFADYLSVYRNMNYLVPEATDLRLKVDTLAIAVNKYMQDSSITNITMGVSCNTISNKNIIDILSASDIPKKVELISSSSVGEFNSSLAISYWGDILDKIAPNTDTEQLELNLAILTSILVRIVGNPETDNGVLTKYVDISPLVHIVSNFSLGAVMHKVPSNIRGLLKNTGTSVAEDWYRAMYKILCNFLDKGFANHKIYISSRLAKLSEDTQNDELVEAPFGIKVDNVDCSIADLKPKIRGLYVYMRILFNLNRKCDLDGALAMALIILTTVAKEGTRYHMYRFDLLKSDLHQIEPD